MLTHVAIRFHGKVWSLPAPNRHCHVVRHIVEQTGVDSVDVDEDDEGFLDDKGTYYRRRAALSHALRCCQVKDLAKIRMNRLFSEDVW